MWTIRSIGGAKLTAVSDGRLIGGGEAARALGVDRTTLRRWWAAGLVRPAKVTAGGQARWDLADLERQVSALRERPGDDDGPATS